MKVRLLRRTLVWMFAAMVALSLIALAFNIFAKPASLAHLLNADYVKIDIRSGRYRVSPAVRVKDCEEFSGMMSRLRPYAAINGTFFDTDYKPQGDLVANGKVLCRGHHHQGIGFTKSGKILFFVRKPNSRINWRGCESGISAGPSLVRNGKLAINVKKDGFSSKAATIKANRSAIGATKDGKLIMCVVSEPITLGMMGYLMIELGAKDAINLDGGGSCGLYKDGRCIVEPTSPVSNVLAVYRR